MENSPTQKSKVIFHMDGDAFFVGCEVAKDPSLKGKAVVTGEERGIVSALSYEAKARGVVRGMPIFKLKKEFPDILILPGDYACYARYSRDMFDIVRRYADDVEEYSIDECFADLTGLNRPLKLSYREIAEKIKREVNTELGLSVSIGLAPSKVLAKVASKWVKPNGLTVIESNTISEFLVKTPIDRIWGIGPRTSQFLIGKGIQSAQDFVCQKREWVAEHLSKPYEVIWLELTGLSILHIDPDQKTVYSSVQKTRSFHPATDDKVFLLSQLSKHIEDACTKARHYKLVAKKVSFFLKTRDFKYYSTEVVLQLPTSAPEFFIDLVQKVFIKIYKKGILYRTTGVVLHELVGELCVQGDLFGDTDKMRAFELIHRHIDVLENKLGKKVVHLASTHNARAQKSLGTDADDMDRNLLFL